MGVDVPAANPGILSAMKRILRIVAAFAAAAALGAAAQTSNLLPDGDFETPQTWCPAGANDCAESSAINYPIIFSDASFAHSPSHYAWLGYYDDALDVIQHDITIPSDPARVTLQFWYLIDTEETDNTSPHDTMTVTITDLQGNTLGTVATLSNMNAVALWRNSLEYDISAYRGETVRIVFTARTDSARPTGFFIDDVAVVAYSQATNTRLANISTRLKIGSGSDVAIAGFVISGWTSKTVVVTAKGPSLAPYGITSPLSDPQLQLVRSSDGATMAVNDNWGNAPNAGDILASGFAPSNSLESAALATLAPGPYTAVVSGVHGASGTGLIEVYEVDHPDVPLINISTRGQVLTGIDVMIGGFVIIGDTPQTVVVTAKGPSLAPYGITNPLANPTLTLVRSSDQTVMATNDDWGTAPNAAQLQASGFAPSNSLESAILITLNPGAYTAIVTGANGGTGTGIVEVYAQ